MSPISSFFEEEMAAASTRQKRGAGPILAVDIGSVSTRAVLFDVVEGSYRFIGRGEAPTTVVEPWNDVMEGVYRAIEQITEATGHQILDREGELIIPQAEEFIGIDLFTATASAGQPIKAILIGLVPDVSVESGKRAADSIYLSLADEFNLADKRTTEQQIDALLKADADLVLIVGGTNGGALDLMRRNIDTVMLAYSLIKHRGRPPVLYAGNKTLREEIVEQGEEIGVQVLTADNVRPTLDVEYLDSAQSQLASLYHQRKSQNTPGFSEVGRWVGGNVYPTTHGFGRTTHLIGGLTNQNVLGVDLGSTATTVAAYLDNQRYLNVFGHLGVGHSAKDVVNRLRPENMTRWLTFSVAGKDEIANYLWNKSLFPHTIPATQESLELEYALAREIIRAAALSARQSWRGVPKTGMLPSFGTILLSGATLTHAPSYRMGAMIALDALQPVGITRLLLDPYGSAAALGTIAQRNPQAVVQVLETGAFHDLGTVIAVAGRARKGEVVLRGTIRPEGSTDTQSFEAGFGTITFVPIPQGVTAEVTIQPRRVEVEGSSRKRKLKVAGGEVGLIIDTRGRPWRFPRTAEKRQELMRSWLQAVTEEG
jgi:uncharacterized protein (TIGR01319 family)